MAMQPKQLIRFERGENSKPKLIYDDAILNEILNKSGTSRVALISVTGAARNGKSYLLNFIRRYFNWEQDDDEDWIGWADPHTDLEGFDWRGGRDPVTFGVWIWPEPFMAQTSSGEVVSVLLIDTQGTLNEFTTNDESMILTALCLLLSTITVYNVKNDIEYESLQLIKKSLQLCSVTSQGNCDHQDLLFTIRDWKQENDFAHGTESGRKYLEEKLEVRPGLTEDAKNCMELIKGSFKNLNCTLFPDPGEKVKARFHKGHLAEIDPTFSTTLETIPDTFHSDNLYIKSFGSSVELLKKLEHFVNAINNQQVVKQQNLESNSTDIQAFEMYKTSIEHHPGEFFCAEDVNAAHNPALEMATQFLKKQNENTKYGAMRKIRSSFDKMVSDYYQSVIHKSEEKGKELHKVMMKAAKAVISTYTANISRKVFSKDFVSEYHVDLQHSLLKEEGLSSFPDLIPKHYRHINYEIQVENLATEIDDKFKEMKRGWTVKNETRMTSQWELARPKALEDYQMQMKASSSGLPFVDQNTYVAYNKKIQNILLNKYCSNLEYEHLAENFQTQLKNDMERLFSELDRINTENMMESVKGKFEKALLIAVQNYKKDANLLEHEMHLTEEGFSQRNKELQDKAKEGFLAEIGDEPEDIKSEFLTKLKTQCEQHGKITFVKFNSTRLRHLSIITANKEEIQSEMFTLLEKHCDSNDILIEGSTDKLNSDVLKQIKTKFDLVRENLPLSMVDEAMNETIQLIEIKCQEFPSKRQKKLAEFHRVTNGLVEDCFNLYTSKMENLNDIDSEESLGQYHANSLHICIQELKNRSGVNDEKLLQPFINNMKEFITDYFNSDIKKTFTYELGQKTVQQQMAEMEAIKLYSDAMDDYFKEKPFTNPSNLLAYHSKMCTKISNNVSAKLKLERKQKEKLFKSIDKQFAMYESINASNTPTNEPAVGIDLGTTYTCVAIYENGIARVIPNEKGSFTFPSYVAFTPTGELIGHPAKEMAHVYPQNTIFDAKRLIGRKFNDKIVQNDVKNWPFEVVNDNNVPKIKLQGNGVSQKTFAPETISAKILNHVKAIAERHLGKKIKKAVITVPAYFNDGQRQATRDAGEIAGLDVLQIINEPTAAAMAYYLNTRGLQERNILVYDLGGGTFDVVILNMKPGGEITVKSVNGDTHLGGEDFDDNLLDEIVKRFQKKFLIDLKAGKNSFRMDEKANAARILRRLRNACEMAKINVSGGDNKESVVNVAAIFGNTDLLEPITRKEFEDLNMDLFLKTLDVVNKALKDSKLGKEDINDIVLVGGSTRIPKIQELLSDFFDGKILRATVNPDEAVALGAAIQAAVLNGNQEHILKNISLKDVTPLSLGLKVHNQTFSKIIERNTPVPAKITKDYSTALDYQESASILIYEGEEQLAKDNHLLGNFVLRGIPPRRRGLEKLLVTMEVNIEGILKVTAVCESTGSKNNVTIDDHRGRLTREDKNLLQQELGQP